MEFIYKAFDKTGKEIQGVISATTSDEAKQKIKEHGLIVVEVKEQRYSKFIKSKIKDIDSYRIFNQLSVLLKAGLNLDIALSMCIESIENKNTQRVLEQILKSIKSGKDVYLAFQETGEFSPLVTSMIKIGEKTGNLKNAFVNIANYTLFNIRFKTEIKNAMMYPLFLITASFLTLLGIFKIIIPRFFSVFTERVEDLPFIAKVLYSISNFINIKNVFISLALLALLMTFFKMRNIRPIYSRFLEYLSDIPFLRRFLIDLDLSRFCYSIASMLKSGVEFIDALKYSADIIKSEKIRNAIKKTIPMIKEGKSISRAFNEIEFLPPIFKGTIKIAEESGKMADMFFDLYQYFDDRFKNSVKRALNILEPMIITFMGIIIGIIVLSLILTIMSVSNIKL